MLTEDGLFKIKKDKMEAVSLEEFFFSAVVLDWTERVTKDFADKAIIRSVDYAECTPHQAVISSF